MAKAQQLARQRPEPALLGGGLDCEGERGCVLMGGWVGEVPPGRSDGAGVALSHGVEHAAQVSGPRGAVGAEDDQRGARRGGTFDPVAALGEGP